jgi:hypothetical protein
MTTTLITTRAPSPTPTPTPAKAGDGGDGDGTRAARPVAAQGERKTNAEAFSEWDQVGNCSCLDQVQAAGPKTDTQR